VLKVCVKELMAMLAQKDKKLPRLTDACGDFLLFQGQRDRGVPHDEILQVAGAWCSAAYQIIPSPILSTPKPLFKQLISVLARFSEYGNVDLLT
jgi:hypothetical protein